MLLVALLAIGSPVDSLALGASEKEVTEGLRRAGGAVEWVDAGEPQAMRRALIDTGLLEAINRASAAPERKDGGFDFGVFRRFALAQTAGRTSVAVMSQAGLRFLLVIERVPIDPSKDRDGWTKARLHRLESALAALSPYELQPVSKDRWGNSFEWKGRKGRDRLEVWYRPERDELRILMY